MTTAITKSEAARATAPRRFNGVAIALHWLTVVLVVGLLAAGWLIGAAADGAQEKQLLLIHRSFGVSLWLVTVLRLGWRVWGPALPPFPASMPRLQQWAATLNEYGLYAVLLVQPLTGLADSLYRGRPFQLFLWQAPVLLVRDRAMAKLMHGLHEAGVIALLVLLGLHVLAALFHLLIRRDGVFQRMAPRAWPPAVRG